MDQHYFKEYYNLERSHWWFLARAAILSGVLQKYLFAPSIGKARILNVGAATGASSLMLERFGMVTSVEYDRDCCEFLKKIGLNVIEASITQLPFSDESFDLVCCFDVIEHVQNDTAAVAELYRVARKGGLVWITVPAFMSLWSEHDEVNHHFRRYTAGSLKYVIQYVPFVIDRLTYFNFWLFIPIFVARKLNRLISLKSKTGRSKSDFSIKSGSRLLNAIFYYIFLSERRLLLANVSFPFGVSLLAVLRKP